MRRALRNDNESDNPDVDIFASRAVARTCNLICIVLDVLKPLGDKAVIENELEGFGIRLNKTPPNISVKKKDKGGIAISTTVPLTKISHEEIKAVMGEYRMANADVHIRCDPSLDEFIDVIEGGRVYIPCVRCSLLFPSRELATVLWMRADEWLRFMTALRLEQDRCVSVLRSLRFRLSETTRFHSVRAERSTSGLVQMRSRSRSSTSCTVSPTRSPSPSRSGSTLTS